MVVCNGDVFEEIVHEKYHLGSIAWQLAIKLDDILPQPTILLFVDYNRLMRIEIIVLRGNVQKWGKDRNYDPVDEWKKYEREIRKQIPQLRKGLALYLSWSVKQNCSTASVQITPLKPFILHESIQSVR